eukprot:5147666-Prymnesium_polylepis.2
MPTVAYAFAHRVEYVVFRVARLELDHEARSARQEPHAAMQQRRRRFACHDLTLGVVRNE